MTSIINAVIKLNFANTRNNKLLRVLINQVFTYNFSDISHIWSKNILSTTYWLASYRKIKAKNTNFNIYSIISKKGFIWFFTNVFRRAAKDLWVIRKSDSLRTTPPHAISTIDRFLTNAHTSELHVMRITHLTRAYFRNIALEGLNFNAIALLWINKINVIVQITSIIFSCFHTKMLVRLSIWKH